MTPVGGIDAAHRQSPFAVRLEQGPTGAQALVGAGAVDVAVVVDVLSFTTTTTIAVARGVEVLPVAWRDVRAGAHAAAHDALLALGRLERQSLPPAERSGAASLSPAAMLGYDGPARVVLPSPNGATIAALLADAGATVIAASLRNAGAVGRHLAAPVRDGARVALVAAGERWPDGSLRPAIEDLWGCGAVIAALLHAVPDAVLSPEARLAVTAVADLTPAALLGCASGAELVGKGFADDVHVAGQRDVDDVVPILGAPGPAFRAG